MCLLFTTLFVSMKKQEYPCRLILKPLNILCQRTYLLHYLNNLFQTLLLHQKTNLLTLYSRGRVFFKRNFYFQSYMSLKYFFIYIRSFICILLNATYIQLFTHEHAKFTRKFLSHLDYICRVVEKVQFQSALNPTFQRSFYSKAQLSLNL